MGSKEYVGGLGKRKVIAEISGKVGRSFPASPFPGYPVHSVFSFPFSRSLCRGENARVLCNFHYFVQSLFSLINKFLVLTVFGILKNLL